MSWKGTVENSMFTVYKTATVYRSKALEIAFLIAERMRARSGLPPIE